MPDSALPEKVYHGTDAAAAESIRRHGLDREAWKEYAGECGTDTKGFSVSTQKEIAEAWARYRSEERGGPPAGVVLEADTSDLPLRAGSPGEWTDPNEFFIAPEDFSQVGPDVFR